MKTYTNLYNKVYSFDNLQRAFVNARKNKTRKTYVIEFEKNLERNLIELREELQTQTYSPLPLKTFILRDPKTRKISKSDFRDRIIHHALVQVIAPIFEKTFIYDSCANQKGKGNLFAVQRFQKYARKATQNYSSFGFCLKADIKHYFNEVNQEILLNILKRKIADDKTIYLIQKILQNSANFEGQREIIIKRAENGAQKSLSEFLQNQKVFALSETFWMLKECRQIPLHKKGMPLSNLTSQFFANVYLNELDYFVKHSLKAKFYIRYVDDFIVLHKSKEQLEQWKYEIEQFLQEKLKLELHPQKSKILFLSHEIDFVGFRNFYYVKILDNENLEHPKNY